MNKPITDTSKLPNLHAQEWFTIKGRGNCAVIEERLQDIDPELYDPSQLNGKQVLIDGDIYVVKGAETFAIPRSKEMPYKLQFSLLAKPTPNGGNEL